MPLARKTFIVEIWTDGNAYEAFQRGQLVKIRAISEGKAEELACRKYSAEVAECLSRAENGEK